MPDDKTIDFVVAFLAIGLLTLGVGSWLLGWLVRTWDRFVNRYQNVTSSESVQTAQTDQTDDRQTKVSVADQWLDRLEVDRTREAVVDLLVYSGWSVSDIRKANILRGDNALIGPEIEAARKRLGIVGEPRHLRVRDDQGERLIPMDA
jgi:hypothetical protein